MLDRKIIIYYAKKRLADIFNTSIDFLTDDKIFGHELRISKPSFFLVTELDKIEDDILDVCDKKTLEKLQGGFMKMKSGNNAVNNVGDYCELMIFCYNINPKVVRDVLNI